MDLKTKLLTLNTPKIRSIKTGSNTTIEDFWDTFVEPLLPSKNIMEKWFNLLLKYVNDKDIVFAVRCFADWEKRNGKNDNYSLRRGFLNTTDNNYSLFYTDNFFAAYFEKMAIDEYIPTYEEFKEAMISREFPARFGRSCSEERVKAAYSIDGKKGKDPQIQTNGYKIAHIVDTGQYFAIGNGQTIGIKTICEKYCPRGKYTDWQQNAKGIYVRHLGKLPEEAKKVFMAHFLRFACPLNYVLTPKKELHTTTVKITKNDIAEYEPFQRFAMKKFIEKYGNVYKEYLKHIMLPDFIFPEDTGDEIINIEYSPIKKYKSKESIETIKRMILAEAKKTSKDDEEVKDNERMIKTPIFSSSNQKNLIVSTCIKKGHKIYRQLHYSSLKDRAVFWLNLKLDEFNDDLTLICHNEHNNTVHIINIPAYSITKEETNKIRIKTNKNGSLYDLQFDYTDPTFTDKFSGISFKKYVTTIKL